jgi:hypothetical protein
MVEKKDKERKKKKGPKKLKRKQARPTQVISQKVTVNIGKGQTTKRRTGTQANRSVQPQQAVYQNQPIPLQPDYSTQLNDLQTQVKANNLSLQNNPFNQTSNLQLLKQLEGERGDIPRIQQPSNEDLKQASQLARGRSITRRRSLSIKADPSPDPSPTSFQPQNDFVSGAESPKITQKPKITELPKTPTQIAAGLKRRVGRPSNAEVAAKKAAEDKAQRRMEEFADEEGTNL